MGDENRVVGHAESAMCAALQARIDELAREARALREEGRRDRRTIRTLRAELLAAEREVRSLRAATRRAA